jgi:hypothetical protein
MAQVNILAPHKMPLSELTKLQPYEPIINGLDSHVLKEQSQVAGYISLSDPNHSWRSGPTFPALFLYPLVSTSQCDKASPLSSIVVLENFGWETLTLSTYRLLLGTTNGQLTF